MVSEPTLPIYSIVAAWRDALKADANILGFCQEHYGKPYKLYVGLDRKRPPTETDCPFIILRGGTKIEGGNQEEFAYAVSVGWAIMNDSRTEAGGVIEMDGVAEVDALGQLILACLGAVSTSHPITYVDYDVESIEFFPQHVGEMALQVEVTPAIGETLVYP